MTVDIQTYTEIISNELHIPKGKTEKILRTYVKQCSLNLLQGNPITIPNICTICSDNTSNTFITNGYIINLISKELGVSVVMVSETINKLFEHIHTDLLNNNTVLLRGLCKLEPVYDKETNSFTVHVTKTTALRGTDLMIHTCKWIKQK